MPEPWDRLPDEPNLWYDRFERFRLMGAGRSVLAVYREYLAHKGAKWRGRSGLPTSWRNAVERFRWRERAEAWDERQRAEERERWKRRRDELRDREWETAQRLIDKAEQMLKIPLVERTVESPDGPTVLKPARWGMADAAKLAETASKLGRLAAEMETDRTTVDVSRSVKELSDEELANIIRGGGGAGGEAPGAEPPA